jgi:SAM-dependent methyltransferase
MICQICGNAQGNRRFVVREMQMGLREEFPYFECGQCECLQIERIPENLSKYYPDNYVPHRVASDNADAGSAKNTLKQWKAQSIRRLLTHHFYFQRSLATSWIARRSCIAEEYPTWVRRQKLDLKLRPTAKILDVGAGGGRLLLELRQNGFTHLTGIDPFIKHDIEFDGVRILRRSLAQMNGEFDLVMLHHSFEHMPEPLTVLRQIHDLLAPERHALVRIPIAGSFAWHKYGVNWAHLDAPRHLFLHTRKSIEFLASRAGFEIVDQFFDSDGFGHWASELYVRDLPLLDGDLPFFSQAEKIFTPADMAHFGELDEKLNSSGEADCSGFYLRKHCA